MTLRIAKKVYRHALLGRPQKWDSLCLAVRRICKSERSAGRQWWQGPSKWSPRLMAQ